MAGRSRTSRGTSAKQTAWLKLAGRRQSTPNAVADNQYQHTAAFQVIGNRIDKVGLADGIWMVIEVTVKFVFFTRSIPDCKFEAFIIQPHQGCDIVKGLRYDLAPRLRIAPEFCFYKYDFTSWGDIEIIDIPVTATKFAGNWYSYPEPWLDLANRQNVRLIMQKVLEPVLVIVARAQQNAFEPVDPGRCRHQARNSA